MRGLRRQRRMADWKDHQDRVRMGWAPPDPPKVKLTNMMRVLTQQAIADPTKVEMNVRREMLARERLHNKANEDRKLTDEQRKQKTETKKLEDEQKGIYAVAFKIRYLINGLHKTKVRMNAEQNGLKGVVVYFPKFSLVIVEGGSKGIKKYKHLMLSRIKWTEEPLKAGGVEEQPVETRPEESNDMMPSANQSLEDNYCQQVWEGQMKEISFRGFRTRLCPTEGLAKDFLGTRWEGVFDLAKRSEGAVIAD